MTIVNFKFGRPQADGSIAPTPAEIICEPTKQRTTVGTPDLVILPAPFTLASDTGILAPALAPTGEGWCWKITVRIVGVTSWPVYVLVPDAVSVDFTDLVQVDPDTLAPTAAPDALWWAMLATGLQSAAPGPQGERGESVKGDKGDKGTKGDPGERGIAGRDGLTPTKSQLGLQNVDNTADADKPVSGPQLAALDLKADKTAVSNVDNTRDADKPVSVLQDEALALKVDRSDNVDSGWQNLTGFATGWTSNSTYPARYRSIKVGGVTTIRLDGVLTRGAGTTSSLITLPASLRPGYAKIVGQNSTTSATPKLGTLEITAPGVLRMIYTEAIADNVTINCSYAL